MLDSLQTIIEAMGRDRIDFIKVDAVTMEKLKTEAADASNEHIMGLKEFFGIPIFVVGGHPNAVYLEIGKRL